jgi:hypothetical protein
VLLSIDDSEEEFDLLHDGWGTICVVEGRLVTKEAAVVEDGSRSRGG